MGWIFGGGWNGERWQILFIFFYFIFIRLQTHYKFNVLVSKALQKILPQLHNDYILWLPTNYSRFWLLYCLHMFGRHLLPGNMILGWNITLQSLKFYIIPTLKTPLSILSLNFTVFKSQFFFTSYSSSPVFFTLIDTDSFWVFYGQIDFSLVSFLPFLFFIIIIYSKKYPYRKKLVTFALFVCLFVLLFPAKVLLLLLLVIYSIIFQFPLSLSFFLQSSSSRRQANQAIIKNT